MSIDLSDTHQRPYRSTICSSHNFRFSKLGYTLDGCIVWNAHNTVFGSKRSAIYALASLAVYFVHSSRPKIQGVVSRDSIVDPQAPILWGYTTKIRLWGLIWHGPHETFTEINIMSAKSTAGAALYAYKTF